MKGQRNSKVIIRKYETADHDIVCKLFYTGIVENWMVAYKRTINMKAPIPSVTQLVQISLLYQYVSSFLSFLLIQFFIQAFIMFIYFGIYWAYTWYGRVGPIVSPNINSFILLGSI